MSRKEIAIADMQCWVFRHAQREWGMSPSECSSIFKKYDLLGFISECYDLLHVSSYQNALNEVEEILQNKGVAV